MFVYIIIANLRFYYIFDVRRNYVFNTQNIREVHLLGFPIQRLFEKSLEISHSDYMK